MIQSAPAENSPLISIVTITYNAARELPATVESVLAQDFRDFEHIVVDGASSDETLAVARRNPDARIVSERDRGLYDAMNKGLRLARGKYVLFLNAGDAFHSSDTLSRYASYGRRGYDIIFGDTVIVDADRRIKGPRHLSAPQQLPFESFSHGMLICHQAFMVRREIAPEYDLAYRFSADYDWTVRCIKAADPRRCVNIAAVAIDYLSDGLTDKNHRASLRERFDVMACHYGRAKAIWRHLGFIPRAIARKLRRR